MQLLSCQDESSVETTQIVSVEEEEDVLLQSCVTAEEVPATTVEIEETIEVLLTIVEYDSKSRTVEKRVIKKKRNSKREKTEILTVKKDYYNIWQNYCF